MKETIKVPAINIGVCVEASPALRRGISMALNAARDSGADPYIMRQIEALDRVIKRGRLFPWLGVVRFSEET